jgi:hypothetical protein
MKEQPKLLTISEMIEQIEIKKNAQFVDSVRRLTEYHEMMLVKNKSLLKQTQAILLCFLSVFIFYLSVAMMLYVTHLIR